MNIRVIWIGAVLMFLSPGLHAQDAVREVAASDSAGFHFPYFLYVPEGVSKSAPVRLLVEPNNTGQVSDDFEIHRASARRMASTGDSHRLADRLGVPLLVPVYPRPRSQQNLYTHYLDRDSMLVKDGPLVRIDLQLLAMIENARGLLKASGIETKPKVWMYGFSASAGFVNRFAALHPDAVRTIVAGAINALPMLPLEQLDGSALPFPLGIADFKALTGSGFDRRAFGEVSQFLYMGYLDRNDTFPYSDAWDDNERDLIAKVLGREMMPARWDRVQKVIASLNLPIQTATYNGVAHATRSEMWDDVAAFFKANDDPGFQKIEQHQYPFVEYREIEVAHVTRIYWKDDPALTNSVHPSDRATFVIAISDWMAGQDYQQLRTFADKAGFGFDLIADRHETVHLDSHAACGNVSTGNGAFQGFQVCLTPADLDKIIPDVAYTLRPTVTGKATWSLNEGVVLRRPSR